MLWLTSGFFAIENSGLAAVAERATNGFSFLSVTAFASDEEVGPVRRLSPDALATLRGAEG